MINRRLSKKHQKLIASPNFLNDQNYVFSQRQKIMFFRWNIKKHSFIKSSILLLIILSVSFLLVITLISSVVYVTISLFCFVLVLYSFYKTYFKLYKGTFFQIKTKLDKHNQISNWYIFRKSIKGIEYGNLNKDKKYIRNKDYFYFMKK